MYPLFMPMLTIYSAHSYKAERKYICDVLIKKFLGIEYSLQFQDRSDWRIEGSNGRKLFLPDVFFQTEGNKWLERDSLPKQPLAVWDTSRTDIDCPLVAPEIPVIYGWVPANPEITDILSVDILGSAFYLLSRYEEVVNKKLDGHSRFPAKVSLAFQENFLERPLVNEYLEIFWWYLKKLWPGLERKKRCFRMILSHDVDHPYKFSLGSPIKVAKYISNQIHHGYSSLLWTSNAKKGNRREKADPFDKFGWLMDISEKKGLRSAFFFRGNREKRAYDPCYPLWHPLVKKRMQEINDRGHEMGFHPGYYTFDNKSQWDKEFRNLKRYLPRQNIVGGRQHFLRFQVPYTWRIWENAGMQYDSTLSFADHAGFRCSTCYEFPVFDVVTRKAMNLFERPLIVMDKTICNPNYMGMKDYEAIDYVSRLKETTRLFNGDFTMLWHNSNLESSEDRNIYESVL